MTESDLYQRIVKPQFDKLGYFVFRVEHPRLPDLYAAHEGKVLWVEFKVVNNKSKDGIVRPKWRPGQLAWIQEHERKGGKNILLCLWYQGQHHYLMPKKEYSEEDLRIRIEIN